MSNFEKKLEEHMEYLNKSIGILVNERSNLDWGHDCNCEYCYLEQDVPQETQKRSEEIKEEIKEINEFKSKLMRHVELTTKEKK